MKPEDKDLLLKDLCARLPYGVIVHCKGEYQKYHEVEEIDVRDEVVRYFEGMHLHTENIINCFPYLRPMSSMTNKEYDHTKNMSPLDYIDWLNTHHFDYRGLITAGLALSTEEFNPYKD